jgi:hypothetical protein
MHADIIGSGCANDAHLLVAVSYGLGYNFGPTGSFFGLLHACGGSTRNCMSKPPTWRWCCTT